MLISLLPQRRDQTLTVVKDNDVLTINGDIVDLSSIPDGSDIPAAAISNQWIVGTVRRVDGELHLSLILPHDADAPKIVRFPDDIVDPPDGPIALPGDEHGDD